MTVSTSNLGGWLQKGFDLYKANLVPLVLLSLVGFVVGAVTLGILALPMAGAITIVVLKLADRQPTSTDVGVLFADTSHWTQAILFFIAVLVVELAVTFTIGLIPILGMLIKPVVSLVISFSTMFTLLLIVDRKLAWWPAVTTSLDKVMSNPAPYLIAALMALVLSCIGVVLCGIGIVVTMPIGVCIMAHVYRDAFGAGAPAALAGSAAPPPGAP
jgi:uncharacterized membrane protein